MIFLDIGGNSINLDHVTGIYRSLQGSVTLELDVLDGDGPAQLTLYEKDAEAFKDWWAHCCKPPELIIIQL